MKHSYRMHKIACKPGQPDNDKVTTVHVQGIKSDSSYNLMFSFVVASFMKNLCRKLSQVVHQISCP